MPRIIKVKSFTEPGVDYTVRQYPNDQWSCDCMYFLYRGFKNGSCDHIRKIRHQKMKFHGYVYNRKIENSKNTKRIKHLYKRYLAIEKKALSTNVGRIKTLEKCFDRLDKIRKEIIKLKKVDLG